MVPVPLKRVRTTRSSTNTGPFQILLHNPTILSHKSLFLQRTCNLQNVLSSPSFPELYNLSSLRTKIDKLALISRPAFPKITDQKNTEVIIKKVYLNAFGLRPATCCKQSTSLFCNISKRRYVFSIIGKTRLIPPSKVATIKQMIFKKAFKCLLHGERVERKRLLRKNVRCHFYECFNGDFIFPSPWLILVGDAPSTCTTKTKDLGNGKWQMLFPFLAFQNFMKEHRSLTQRSTRWLAHDYSIH